jgi:hypothetical protein
LSENHLAIIRSKRGPHNRLGFATQLCYLRFPRQPMTLEAEPPAELLAHIAQQIQVHPDAWMPRGTWCEQVATRRGIDLARFSQLAGVGDPESAPDLHRG